MARGKFERRRKKNYGAIVITWFVVIAIAVGVGFALGNRNKEEAPDPSATQMGSQQKPQENENILPDGNTDENEENTNLPENEENTEDPVEDIPEEDMEDPVEDIPEEDQEDPIEDIPEDPEEDPETDLLPDDAPITVGEQVAAVALQQVGKSFKMGGTGPDSFDTTGLVVYCFKESGITAPRRTAQMAEFGTEVALEDLQPGDVVIFSYEAGTGKFEYPGIYVGDGKFVAARNESNPVSEMDINSTYFAKRFSCARRFG